jgi:hypothetical protein
VIQLSHLSATNDDLGAPFSDDDAIVRPSPRIIPALRVFVPGPRAHR